MPEEKKYRWWECTGCGNEVHSIDYPTLGVRIPWSDGHRCCYQEKKREEIYDKEERKARTKGD